MSNKKTVLTESQVRRWGKLAAIGKPITENWLDTLIEEEEEGEEEMAMDAEEAPADEMAMDAEEAPAGDMEDKVEDIVAAVVDAIADVTDVDISMDADAEAPARAAPGGGAGALAAAQHAHHDAHQQRGDRGDIETRAVEAPAHRQAGDKRVVPPPRGLRTALAPDRLDRFARHQHADGTEQDDVERADDHVDLADCPEEPEQERAEARTDHAARHHYRTHAIIDPAAPAMRQHAGHAGTGDLGRGRSRGHGRRDAVEDQQRRGQETATHAEQARKDPRQPPQRDDP